LALLHWLLLKRNLPSMHVLPAVAAASAAPATSPASAAIATAATAAFPAAFPAHVDVRGVPQCS